MTDRIVASREGIDTRAGLDAWFAHKGAEQAKVSFLPGPQATGYSHETIVFELAGEKLVARVEPLGEHNVFPDPDLSVEFRLMEAIAEADVPLPRLIGYETDSSFLGAPFYVMEHLDGLVPPDSPPYCMGGWLYDSTPGDRAAVWWNGLEAMTRVHLVDRRGLEFVNCGRPIGFEGELNYWDGYIAFCGGDIAAPARRAWDWLTAKAPSDTSTALCWGDSRLGNQMFSGTNCIALLDWEMACLSDPVEDLAWFVYFDDVFSSGLGVPRLDGIPTREESIARYEEINGTSVKNFDYFEVFAGVRFAVIMQRLFTLQAEMGLATAGSPTDNFVTAHLDKMCDEKGIP
ncbi:MAG: phosphotransferase family protein [Actinomycetota bacterium]